MPHFSVKFGDVASPNGTEGSVFNANCQCRILLDQPLLLLLAMRTPLVWRPSAVQGTRAG